MYKYSRLYSGPTHDHPMNIPYLEFNTDIQSNW